MRAIGPEADQVALSELVTLILDQQLDLAMQDVGNLLTGMTDPVPVVTTTPVEGQEVRLDDVVTAAAEQLVEHTGSTLHPRHRGGTAANDLDAIDSRRRGGFPEQLGDVESEVLGDQLKALERDAALPVLERRQRRRRDADLSRLGSQRFPRLGAQPADSPPHESSEFAVAAGLAVSRCGMRCS